MVIFIAALASFPVLSALGRFLPNERYFTSMKDTPAYKERVSAQYDIPFLEAFPTMSGLLKSAENRLDFASKNKSLESDWLFQSVANWDECFFQLPAGISVRDYFTANNYLHAKEILQSSVVGAVTGLVINIASAPLTSTIFKSSSEQTCGRIETNSNTSSEVPAHDYASAAETFCLAIQAAKIAEAEGLDSAEDLPNGIEENRQGRAGITKEFILAQAGNFGPICLSYGITWQRRSGIDSS